MYSHTTKVRVRNSVQVPEYSQIYMHKHVPVPNALPSLLSDDCTIPTCTYSIMMMYLVVSNSESVRYQHRFPDKIHQFKYGSFSASRQQLVHKTNIATTTTFFESNPKSSFDELENTGIHN